MDIVKRHRINKDKMESAEFLSRITKEDKLISVLTLVIYWGSNSWDVSEDVEKIKKLKENK